MDMECLGCVLTERPTKNRPSIRLDEELERIRPPHIHRAVGHRHVDPGRAILGRPFVAESSCEGRIAGASERDVGQAPRGVTRWVRKGPSAANAKTVNGVRT